MQTSARDSYLVTEVMTATPQKLQLMLIEAALRFGQQARDHWLANRVQQTGESLIRCQQIVAQILGGLKTDQQRELTRRVAALYVFIFNCLVQAHLRHDQAQLEQALEILALEQETWRAVCQKLGSRRDEPPAERLAVEA